MIARRISLIRTSAYSSSSQSFSATSSIARAASSRVAHEPGCLVSVIPVGTRTDPGHSIGLVLFIHLDGVPSGFAVGDLLELLDPTPRAAN